MTLVEISVRPRRLVNQSPVIFSFLHMDVLKPDDTEVSDRSPSTIPDFAGNLGGKTETHLFRVR